MVDSASARHLLRKVDDGLAFGFRNGKKAGDLRELARGVLTLSSEDYRHHVFVDHNDFSNWLLDVIGDEKLARDLFNADQRKAGALLKARVHYLEEQAGI